MSGAVALSLLISGAAIGENTRPNKPGELPPYKALSERTDHEKLFIYRCETIAETTGFEDSTDGQATKHSCDGPNIGIALYAGSDLGKHSPEKVGQYFVDKLARHGLSAKVFIRRDHPHGSSMTFYIDGRSWLESPVRPSEGHGMIQALAAETKLILYSKGKLSEWPIGPNDSTK